MYSLSLLRILKLDSSAETRAQKLKKSSAKNIVQSSEYKWAKFLSTKYYTYFNLTLGYWSNLNSYVLDSYSKVWLPLA